MKRAKGSETQIEKKNGPLKLISEEAKNKKTIQSYRLGRKSELWDKKRVYLRNLKKDDSLPELSEAETMEQIRKIILNHQGFSASAQNSPRNSSIENKEGNETVSKESISKQIELLSYARNLAKKVEISQITSRASGYTTRLENNDYDPLDFNEETEKSMGSPTPLLKKKYKRNTRSQELNLVLGNLSQAKGSSHFVPNTTRNRSISFQNASTRCETPSYSQFAPKSITRKKQQEPESSQTGGQEGKEREFWEQSEQSNKPEENGSPYALDAKTETPNVASPSLSFIGRTKRTFSMQKSQTSQHLKDALRKPQTFGNKKKKTIKMNTSMPELTPQTKQSPVSTAAASAKASKFLMIYPERKTQNFTRETQSLSASPIQHQSSPFNHEDNITPSQGETKRSVRTTDFKMLSSIMIPEEDDNVLDKSIEHNEKAKEDSNKNKEEKSAKESPLNVELTQNHKRRVSSASLYNYQREIYSAKDSIPAPVDEMHKSKMLLRGIVKAKIAAGVFQTKRKQSLFQKIMQNDSASRNSAGLVDPNGKIRVLRGISQEMVEKLQPTQARQVPWLEKIKNDEKASILSKYSCFKFDKMRSAVRKEMAEHLAPRTKSMRNFSFTKEEVENDVYLKKVLKYLCRADPKVGSLGIIDLWHPKKRKLVQKEANLSLSKEMIEKMAFYLMESDYIFQKFNKKKGKPAVLTRKKEIQLINKLNMKGMKT